MFALLLVIFVQTGLDVQIVNTRLDSDNDGVRMYTEAACASRAETETKVLPLQPGNVARWQYAKCVQISS